MKPYQHIAEALAAACPGIDLADIVFSTPPAQDMGDLAIPMFPLARKLGVPPQQLAREMLHRVQFDASVKDAHATGPYLNIRLNRSEVGVRILRRLRAAGASWGSGGAGNGKKVLIEHTSINPNADPHVGRGRCAMIGDAITRLLRFEGYEVKVHYYVNDMGRQIGLLVLAYDRDRPMSFNEVLAAYVQANKKAESDPEFAAQGYELLARVERGDPGVIARFQAVTDMCLEGQLKVLRRLGARYDSFDHESAYVNDPRLEGLLTTLRDRGALFTDEEKRLVADLSKLGYTAEEGRFFVLRRANGSSMYGFRDLAYTIDKMEKRADINLQVLGEDHKLYAQQLALLLSAAEIPYPEVIYYSYILLTEGKMSTRQGKVVLLSDFLDRASQLARLRVAEQCAELSNEEQQTIAEQVAVAAIRFTVLRVKPSKNVTFDMDTALSFQGDTGPYIQYCCARIRSILRKWDGPEPGSSACFAAESDAEWALLLKMAEFPEVVQDAVKQRSCAFVANYALELARQFTTFYHECPVLKAESPELTDARLCLCQATLQTLSNAMGILGIEVPERM